MKKIILCLSLLSIILFSSCVSKKKFIYFQGAQDFNNSSTNYEPLIQNDDILTITVSSFEQDAAAPYNLETSLKSEDGVAALQTYLVDNKGNIEFPGLGTINVAGYSINETRLMIQKKLLTFIKDPVINIRILNFKVTVLGEVTSPGVVKTDGQRLTLIEALALSGDLTMFGKRDNILIIRDYQGTKTFNRVNITQADFVNSPFYYLDQNDVVYVEAKKSKIDSSALGANVTTILSIASFLITITFLLTK